MYFGNTHVGRCGGSLKSSGRQCKLNCRTLCPRRTSEAGETSVGEEEGKDAAADADELSEDVILICSSSQQSCKHIRCHERAETEHRMGSTVSSTHQGAPSPGMMPLPMEKELYRSGKGLFLGVTGKEAGDTVLLRTGRVKRSG